MKSINRIKMESMSTKLIMLILFIASLQCALSVSSETFDVSFKLTPSSGTGINIDLIDPSDQIFSRDDNPEFWFVVTYDKSFTMTCDIFIDDEFATTIEVSDGWEKIKSENIKVYDGHHTWKVHCKDTIGNEKTSVANAFSVDLDPPKIRLNNKDAEISLTDSISLSFTPIDNFAIMVDCKLTVFRLDTGKIFDIINLNALENGKDKTYAMTSLDHGNYTWNVACKDEVGNKGTSIEKLFYIDLKKEFNIEINQDRFRLGEKGVYIINAPFGSEVKVLITDPKFNTIDKTFSGQFPVIDTLETHFIAGSYKIEAFLNYNDAVKQTSIGYGVENTLSASLGTSHNQNIYPPEAAINFSATSIGGIGAITYEWDFGDDTEIVTDQSIQHKYSELGGYTVSLTATDNHDNSFTVKKVVRIRELFTVTLKVIDKIDKKPIKNAKIYIDHYSRKTDEYGETTLELFGGLHTVTVMADTYKTFYTKKLDFDYDTSETIEMLRKGYDYNQSEIDKEEKELVKKDYEEVSDKDTTTAENQEEYPKPSEELDTNPTGDDLIDTIDTEVIPKIDSSIQELTFLDAENKNIASILDIKENLERAKTQAERIRRDLWTLDNVRKLDEEAREIERKNITDRFKTFAESTISSLNVLENDDYIRYPTDEEIEQASLDYLEFKNISLQKNKDKYFVEHNQKIQSLVTVSSQIKVIDVEYLSGDQGYITLLVYDITHTEDLKDTEFVVSIPKDIAEHTDNIRSLTYYDIINPDPMISYDLTENKRIAFYIEKDISIDKAKEIRAALIADPKKIDYKSKGFSAVGFAVFSDISEIDNPIVVFEVMIIILLLVVYIFYQFEIIDKVKKAILYRDEQLVKLKSDIEDLEQCLSNNEINNAEVVYTDIMDEYKKFSPKSKSRIIKQIMDLYDRIVSAKVNEKINATLALLKENDLEHAKSSYQEVQNLYTQLSKDYKSDINERCSTVFTKLTKAISKATSQVDSKKEK